MIKTILWDVDRTLLDFDAAERAAIQSLFVEFGLGECSEEQVARYSVLNMKYWEKLERGEITKPQVLVGRFEEFFAEEGIDVSLAPQFNDAYQLRLGDTIVYRDDSYEIVKSLRGKVRQCVVSNGTVVAQTKKLTRSGLGALMDGVFLSEQLGAEKPKKEFFDQVFAAIGPVEKGETMIVGDSLTSDIRGTVVAQTKKLTRSGLGALMDGVFLSEQLGAEKPKKEFFDQVFAAIGPVEKGETMIVGDSLTSDIRGGDNAGIVTCWYNPEGIKAPEDYRIDHEIRDLHEVYGLL